MSGRNVASRLTKGTIAVWRVGKAGETTCSIGIYKGNVYELQNGRVPVDPILEGGNVVEIAHLNVKFNDVVHLGIDRGGSDRKGRLLG